MSKKILSLLLVLVMLVGCFASCGLINGNKDNDDNKRPPVTDDGGDDSGNTTACTHEYANGCDPTCNLCGATREVAPCADNNGDDLCDICSRDLTCPHEWTDDCDAVCNLCNFERVPAHQYAYDCSSTCVCGATRYPDAHKDGKGGTYDSICDDCGATLALGTVNYTYNDAVATLASNWNPHTYQVADDSYPISFITSGLYSFVFNDAGYNVVEGKNAFEGYKIVPEMAAELPVDVTEAIKAAHPEFNIPESATTGYAYKIALNKNATWSNGTPITADDYIESMKDLLDPTLLNYRATDYYAQSFAIAGAEEYANQGQTVLLDNYATGAYGSVDALTKGEDGIYVTSTGEAVYISIGGALSWLSGNSLYAYVNAYGDAYFNMENWPALLAKADDNGFVPCNDENLALLASVISTEAWGESAAHVICYLNYYMTYPEFDWSGVGLLKTGDHEITIVLAKSLAGFNLLYNLTGNWLVYQDYYDALKYQDSNGVWFNRYNTSVETTMSYGPYKMTQYQSDKDMTFERNLTWYGYYDGNHMYVDPEDGKVYDMYQTDKVYCQVVPERATRKLMFLKGQLMGFGLGSEDFEEYRNSEYTYVSPSETIFFLILNGHMTAIQGREAAEGFDKTKYDLETMTLLNFRKAVAVTYDKEAICTAVSPADSGGYGLFGESFIYDPDTGSRYRDTEQAKRALCEFYSVDVEGDFGGDLDKAVDSITGYDPATAKELFKAAFDDAIAAGYITDTDGDGKSDQTIEITYAISTDSEFYTKLLNYLNEKMNEVTAGTPFENKVVFVKSAPLDNDWSTQLKNGNVDTVLGGWSGSALDPYSCTDLYTNPNYQYDAKWFDSTSITKTLTINGEEVTLNLKQWSDALNGATVKAVVETDEGPVEKEYCFGDGVADVDTRLSILAMIETAILGTYNYLPMLQEGSMALLSQQVYYVIEEYNSIMGRGGMTYMKYNYTDAEWAAYVAEQGGELKY